MPTFLNPFAKHSFLGLGDIKMTNLVILCSIAAMGGIAVTLQAQFMGVMDQKMGTIESVFITYGGGTLLIGIAILFIRGGNLPNWHSVPWYTLLSGLFGLLIVGALSYCVPKLGVVATLSVFIATQIIMGAIIDHFGLLGSAIRLLDLTRLAGIVILFLGSWLIVKP